LSQNGIPMTTLGRLLIDFMRLGTPIALTIGATALLLAEPVRPLRAEPVRATVQQILDGPETFIDQRQAKVKDVATDPQQVSTRNSRAQLLFGSGAAGRLSRHSRLSLGQACILLEQGQMLVSGRQGACTRSVRLSVRGTNFILETFDNGDAAVTSLQGVVEVETLRNGEPTGTPQQVSSGQRLRLLLGPGLSTVIALTPSDYRSILEGPLFRGFDQRLPDQGALEDYLAANVPGVTLPKPQPQVQRPAFSFGFGFGFGGGGDRPSSPAPSQQSPGGYRY